MGVFSIGGGGGRVVLGSMSRANPIPTSGHKSRKNSKTSKADHPRAHMFYK